jgi:hypothetical protein
MMSAEVVRERNVAMDLKLEEVMDFSLISDSEDLKFFKRNLKN